MDTRPVILLVLLAAIFPITIVQNANSDNPRETPVVQVVRQNAAAVVNISTEQIVFLRESPVWGRYGSEFDSLFDQFWGTQQRTRALKLKSVGSGVIVDKAGLVVTNAHVVHMASNIFVIFNDGAKVPGKIVYENIQNDLALVRIGPGKSLTEVKLGGDDDLMIGETAVAIGNPLGLENSVTVGIISGKERELYSSDGEKIGNGFIQTDAPINPGNSGGALLNLNGELVGINVAVVQNSQSIGFAIPVKRVREALATYKHNPSLTVKDRQPAASPVPAPGGIGVPEEEGTQEESWDPSREMERIRRQMDEMFRGSFGQRGSGDPWGAFNTDIFYDAGLDLKETPDGYEIKLNIAGLDKDKIDVEINEHSLTVSGQGSGQEEQTSPGSAFRSRQFHSFLRTIPLPEDADSASVKTGVQGDNLVIRMGRKKH
ncbi:MAG: trypsin-like peptidase domain-containing protein [Candidatus Omnitrophica bacterium]|nr:trypsin-like peptidase domain-containing protein [Candidatus Omnitrophota bacterium]